jgi:pimeloyl-ACP methyl ester carboxylesterase
MNTPSFVREVQAQKFYSVTGATLLAIGLLIAAFPVAAQSPACTEIQLGVTVPAVLPLDRTNWQVHALLCGRAHQLPRSIQVLLAGATESGLAYWDFPHPDFYEADPQTWDLFRDQYSYVQYLADLGYASLTLDRIGTGKSDRPPAHQVTIASNADVLHQVIQKLKDGTLGLPPFETVITVGRSLGGPIIAFESAKYGDVDGLIIQSFRHHQEPPFAAFATTLMPAQLEPRFAFVPPGYLTTQPDARGAFFFTANADPHVVAHEEATKDTITDGEAATFFPSFAPQVGASNFVTVPVLSVVGDLDSLFCTPGCPRATEEASHWPLALCFESVVIPNTGHDMNLEPSGKTEVFPVLRNWVQNNFGPGKVPCATSDAVAHEP